MKIQRMNLARRLIWAVVMGVIVCACLLYLVETPRSATYNVQVLSGERMVVNGVEYGDGHDFKACPEMRPRKYVLRHWCRWLQRRRGEDARLPEAVRAEGGV